MRVSQEHVDYKRGNGNARSSNNGGKKNALHWRVQGVSTTLRLVLIDVVADNAAEDCASGTADDRALHLVPAGDCADHCTSARANRCVTLGVLHNRSRRRSAVNRG